MIVERIFDKEIISSVLNHPKVQKHVRDDFSLGCDLEYPIIDHVYYVACFDDSVLVGLFVGTAVSMTIMDCHTSILPEFWGDKAKEAGRLAIDWAFSNTGFDKLVGCTPITNKLAIKYNEDIGFEREGINKKSIMKNGQLIDQIYFGLERRRWVQIH